MKQFTPIVTIQRKPSVLDQKQTSKKLILIPKTEQRIVQSEKNDRDLPNHVRGLSFHDEDEG